MTFLNFSNYAEKCCSVFFSLFLFFNTIFCGYTRVNNLFHLSLICMLLALIGNTTLLYQLFNNHHFNYGFILILLMLSYFCLTMLWSFSNLAEIISYIKHSLYLLFFILMFRLMTLQGYKLIVLTAIASGITILLFLTFWLVDKQTLLINRMREGFFGAPKNVIDLAGYFNVGIFIYLIIIRDTGYFKLYFPILLLLVASLLTQSRGPLLALIFTIGIYLYFKYFTKRNYLFITIFIVLILSIISLLNNFNIVFLLRFKDGYSHMLVRLDIWIHTLELVSEKLIFGWGLNKTLLFINKLGSIITTTHSIYLAALLKGGIIGLLLLILVIAYNILLIVLEYENSITLEGSLFIFVIIFYLTQGMFIINNPDVSWEIFWMPLAIMLTSIKKNKNQILK